MSNFDFLTSEWKDIHEAASKAESAAIPDPRTSCFYARRTLELAARWAYKFDRALKLPYQDNLSALIHEPTFKHTAGDAVFNKAKLINKRGNDAVHSHRDVSQADAVSTVQELFHFCYWFARLYARRNRPDPSLTFDPALLPTTAIPKQTLNQLKLLESQLKEKDEKLSVLLADKDKLDAEIKLLRTEVAKAKKAAEKIQDDHDYNEDETRDRWIDELLKESGWPLDQKRDREFPVTGMPNTKGEGKVDYVLWGDDGKPLAVVEAKRTRRDPRVGEQQAKLYADCLEAIYGQRPIIFYSNGYEHWIWDDAMYAPRRVQGFYKKAELELLILRRSSRRDLASATIDEEIAGRYYQTRAIRRIGESFEKDNERKSLLVMATGSGKTRTVIALCDLLIRCNWAKRVLFLADRVALVNQATNAFKAFLPDSSPVNLVTEKDSEGRVYLSTYPTMMGLIDTAKQDGGKDGQKRFGVGHFDLVVIDEAHRSVYQKYGAIFDYFDSLLVGLTATPKDEIDKNTYGLFDLETGVPTDAYDLDEAVDDKFLVPPKAVSVPLKFEREGIKYDDLSEEDKDEWDAKEWDEEGNIPDKVEAAAVNKWLFNIDTVDKVLEHLMTRGQYVAGGDLLGKTIIFAKNQDHADFIKERFDINYPHYKGEFARIITFKTEYAQNVINSFSNKDKLPQIAISVDMLDTGIDVPEVVNLVFFKLVRSKTKFWQMVGRGTRLCPDLFGPGQHKEFFYIFDYCQNLEYFSQNPAGSAGSTAESLSTRLFKRRLELIRFLDGKELPVTTEAISEADAGYEVDPTSETQVRALAARFLHRQVASMNLENFLVRAHRRSVEKFAQKEAWEQLKEAEIQELADEVAPLPTQMERESEEAKRFDLLLLNLQLSLLNKEPAYERLRQQVVAIAGLLEEKHTIPMVNQQMIHIEAVQTEEWWADVTLPMLEVIRRRLRDLVQFIEKAKRKPVYTNFDDMLGDEVEVGLDEFVGADTFERFRSKAQAFLREHLGIDAVRKLRTNETLTKADLDDLERILLDNEIGNHEYIEQAKQESEGFGVFVRSLVGIDREVAKRLFGEFLQGSVYNANQIEFINLIVNQLVDHGIVDASLLYESPFTDISPQGPDAIFTSEEVDKIMQLLDDIRATAIAA
ncbi:Type I restriction-modification system, restriction subunit R [Rhodopirellula islandica]|uniref:Type I restriction-modification system, restriction subunit R n=1 Tax=Rhodopirellula islandica TaxID=595434 RepID=A0A0J1EK57_RHOIS|nr:DEAD/DEAH box helicase family protein [Rhodopirellula islandica]KLU05879.1 Type I restriction-modification system, restriction subunit R [Rhodopirellula islandica]